MDAAAARMVVSADDVMGSVVASLLRTTSNFSPMDEWEIRRRRRAGQGRSDSEVRGRVHHALQSLGLADVPRVIADELQAVRNIGREGHTVVMDVAAAALVRESISSFDYSRLTAVFATTIGKVDASDEDRLHEWWGPQGTRIRRFYEQVARLSVEQKLLADRYYRTAPAPSPEIRSAAIEGLIASGRNLPWPLGYDLVMDGDPMTDALLGIVATDLADSSSGRLSPRDVERLAHAWSSVVAAPQGASNRASGLTTSRGTTENDVAAVKDKIDRSAAWLGPELSAFLGRSVQVDESDPEVVCDAIFRIDTSVAFHALFPLLQEKDWPEPVELSPRLARQLAGPAELRRSSVRSLLVLRNVGPTSVRTVVLALVRHAQEHASGSAPQVRADQPSEVSAKFVVTTSAPVESPARRRQRERNAAVAEARRAGATLDEIGEQFGVTRERIRQILSRTGGPTAADARAARDEAAALDDARTAEQIRSALTVRGPSTPDEVAEEIGEARERVSLLWPKELAHLKIRGVTWVANEWSDEEIFAAIREAASYAFPLTTNEYRRLTSIGEVRGPSLPRIHQRYGSWSKACELAGVEAGQARRDNYQSRWTDEELLDFTRRYLEDPAFPNSFLGFDGWRREVAPEGPSAMTVRNRLGRWEDIKRAALGPRADVPAARSPGCDI